MTDSETTRDPCDDYMADDVSVISDTTHGTDDVTSPSAWAGLQGLMKSPTRKRECFHSTTNQGDCSPIIPSQNRTQNLSGDAQQDDCMSDNESVMSTSLLTVKGRLSKPRDTTPITHSEDNNHRVNSLDLLTSDKSNHPFSQDNTENVTYADEQVHSFSVPTKSPGLSKLEERTDRKHQRKAPEVNYTQILDEIFRSKVTLPQHRPQIPPVGDFHRKGDSVPTQHSSNECLEISVSEKMDSASASSSQLSDLLLSEKCVKPSPRRIESDVDDPESNHSVIYTETRVMFAPPKVITPSTGEAIPLSNLTQKTCSRSLGHQHGIDKTQIDENLQGQILTENAGCKQPPSIHQLPVSQMTLKDLPAHEQLVSPPTQEKLCTNEHSASQLTQLLLSFQQHTKNEDDLTTHLEPMPKMTIEDLSAYQHPISQLPRVDLSTHQQPVSQLPRVDLSTHQHPISQLPRVNLSTHQQPLSQLSQVDLSTHQQPISQLAEVDLSTHQQPVSPLTQEELSTQLLDFIVEFTQVSNTSSGIGPSGSGPERLLESLPQHQNISSPDELLHKNETSEKILYPNQETSSMSVQVANSPNNGPEIGKHSQDKQLLARSKNGKQKLTKFCPPMLSQKDMMGGPSESVHLAPHPCDPSKMESGPWSSSKSTQGLQTKKSDKSQFPANVFMDHYKQSSGTVGDKRLTGSANEKETLLNLMARYQAMERALQDRPSKSSALEISTELKQIQGAVAQLNEQHKTERGRLSVRVGVKGLSKSRKKQLKKELQELGDRQKHLLQVVHRHKQLNFRLKQVIACIDATGTSCSGGESSKDKHGNVNTFPPSRPAAEASTVQADITDSNGRRPFIEKPSSVPTIYKTDIVDRFHDITAAENGGSALFESSFRKDNASTVFLRDQNGVSRTYGAIEARTSNVTGYHDRKKECLDNDVDVLSQYYRDDMEQTQKTDFSDSILISESNPTCIVDNSVITTTNNELLAKADVCPAPCSQIKETEAFVKSVHSSGAVDRTASQISEIEDSQQDLFSQGSSEQEGDRRMVEEIIATKALSHESDCPDRDIRHIGGRVRQGKEEWVWTDGGTDQRGLKKGEMEEDAMDRGVEGRMDSEVGGRMDSEVGGRMDSEVEGLVVRRVDGRIGSEDDGQMDSEVEERIDSGLDGRMNRGVEGRMDTQADRKTDRHADRTDSEVDERISAQTDRRMDRRVSGQINTQNDGRVAIHIDDNTAWQGGVSVNMQEDDKLEKKKGADVCEMNWNSATSPGPVSQMKRKAEDSTAPNFEGRSECETKKIKTCTAEQFVKSVEGGQAPCKPGISQSESDATKSEVKERETYHQKAGNRNSEGESIQSKIASDKKEGFVLSVKQTCSKEVDGPLVPISLKSMDGSLNKSREIIPEYRNINNDNTTGQVNGPSLSSHGNSGTLSSAVGAEGSTPNLMSPSNVRSVCSARMEVTCLSLPEQGTKKVKNVSLMSPPPHPLKNIATPPQKLQSENLPASTFLSPGSTVASSDVFPVSCRELVRRMAGRDAREKQSRKDKVLLQEEAPSNYIAIPIGRIEDFSENLQVKDVDDDTQTSMFMQPQVPSAPKPVATSKMAALPTLVEKGVLTPGKDVLSVRAEGKVFRATLSRKGHIIGSGGEMFRTPTSWCQAVSGAGTVNKLQSYNMVLYMGQPLSSFVVSESTESSGQQGVRAQTKSQGKLVSSSITRSLKTVNKSTSLPRQSSTTTAANKVRTKSLTYSVTKSLSEGTGAAPSKTSSRQTGIPFPVPPNRNSAAARDLVAKGNKEASPSGPSELMRVLRKCTIKLIDDAEIIHCPEIDSTFWMTDFEDIRLSDSLWDSVDCWN